MLSSIQNIGHIFSKKLIIFVNIAYPVQILPNLDVMQEQRHLQVGKGTVCSPRVLDYKAIVLLSSVRVII